MVIALVELEGDAKITQHAEQGPLGSVAEHLVGRCTDDAKLPALQPADHLGRAHECFARSDTAYCRHVGRCILHKAHLARKEVQRRPVEHCAHDGPSFRSPMTMVSGAFSSPVSW